MHNMLWVTCMLVAATPAVGFSPTPNPPILRRVDPVPILARPTYTCVRPSLRRLGSRRRDTQVLCPLQPARRATHASARAPMPPGEVCLDALFTYADPRPYTLDSWESRAFLLTNVGYFAAGVLVGGPGGNVPLASLLELAGVFSTWYHCEQCSRGGTRERAVQRAMAFDYLAAIPTLAGGLLYSIDLAPEHIPWRALSLMVLAFAALAAGWVWDRPHQYFVLHGLWHVLGAIAAAELARFHAQLLG